LVISFKGGKKMKKFTTVAMLAVAGLSLVLSSCGAQTYEIALVTDVGDIDDKSFNQGAWEGVVDFAEENNKTYQYYKPTAVDNTEYVNTIDLAIEGGAKVVVTPGFLFETPIFLAQDEHPDVSFILLDGVPHSADYSEFRQEDNVLSILYAEEQAGYLAGYAAVADGFRSLGFMGGMAVPAVVKFGVGFMLGAQAAATVENEDVTIQYHYTGDFADTPENAATAETMYEAGVEVIFAAGGAVGLSVMSEAEKADKKVIGVDVNQGPGGANLSDTVITSAMKGLGTSVVQALEEYYAGEFPGGEVWVLDASNDGVGLPTDAASWGFENFTVEAYNDIYDDLATGSKTVALIINGSTITGATQAEISAYDTAMNKVSVTWVA
jgi:basic membrane protein A and related proteins